MTHRVPVRYQDSQDPLKRTRLQELSEALIPDAFDDARKLAAELVTQNISPQLYAAIVSIDGNIGEAYSRSSGKERALRFEYALGETRESMSWYKGGRAVLGDEVTVDRLDRLEEIRRILLAIIPRERGRSMK
jgi:four helix bundle protein